MTSEEWTAVSAVGTVLGALVSAGVCYQTWRVLVATQQTLADARAEADRVRRPVIEVTAWPKADQPVIMLSVRNTGNGAARNLKLTLDHNFQFNGEEGDTKNLRNYTLFRDRIDSLSPRAEIDIVLGAGSSVFSKPDLCPQKFMVETKYTFEQNEYGERVFIDISAFDKHSVVQDVQLTQLKKLTEAVESVAFAMKNGPDPLSVSKSEDA
jgi:hypothetical protein